MKVIKKKERNGLKSELEKPYFNLDNMVIILDCELFSLQSLVFR